VRRIVFDIETEPFTKAFRKAKSVATKIKHAPKLRLACAYIEDTGEYRYFVPETAAKLVALLQRAKEIVSFNGQGFDIPVLQRHYKLKGPVPKKRIHTDLHLIMSDVAQHRISLDRAALLNLNEKKHTDGREMGELNLEELKVACRSDVWQTYRLFKLFETGKLKIPAKQYWDDKYSKIYRQSKFDRKMVKVGMIEQLFDRVLHDKCPGCGFVKDIDFLPSDTWIMVNGRPTRQTGRAFCLDCRTSKFVLVPKISRSKREEIHYDKCPGCGAFKALQEFSFSDMKITFDGRPAGFVKTRPFVLRDVLHLERSFLLCRSCAKKIVLVPTRGANYSDDPAGST